MTLKELKEKLEKKEVPTSLIIFVCKDNTFLAKQYIDEIRKLSTKSIQYIENLKEAAAESSNIFFDVNPADEDIKILYQDKFDYTDSELCNVTNTLVVCSSIEKDSEEIFRDYIIECPKIENWQLKDYAYSILQGVPQNKIDWLIENCNSDIFRLQQEIDRFILFTEAERKYAFDDFYNDGIYDDLSSQTIFNFTNAIAKKDIASTLEIIKHIKNIDISEMGLITILYNNFKNILKIQLSPNATAESLKIPSKQFYAIKNYSVGSYTNSQLIHIFETIISLDSMIKSGILPITSVIDYIIVKILGA